MTNRNEKGVRIPVTTRHDDEPEVAPNEIAPEEEAELLPEDEL